MREVIAEIREMLIKYGANPNRASIGLIPSMLRRLDMLESSLAGRVLVKPIITRSQWGTWNVRLPQWSLSCNGSEDTRPDDEVLVLFQESLNRMQAIMDKEATP